ncbi:MAG: hypothetical protein ABUS57_14025, partial [Pseudomonadota bacterium]
MALQDPQAEPSMEEILASIRRIISEEEQAPAAPEEVLDLTQAAPAARAPSDDDIVFETEAVTFTPEPRAPAPAPAPVVAAPPPRVQAIAPMVDTIPDAIISPPSASAAAGSLARL